jgi:hypothetical protein
VGLSKLVSSVNMPPGASQPLAIERVSASSLEVHRGGAEQVDCRGVLLLGTCPGHQGSGTGQQSQRPRRAGGGRPLRQPGQGLLGGGGVANSHRGFVVLKEEAMAESG